MRTLIIAVACLMLLGCGAKYVQPAQGEKVAYLNFAVESDAPIGYTSALAVLTDPRSGHCGQYRPIAQVDDKHPFIATENPENVPIPVGREFGLRAWVAPIGNFGYVGCSYITIFTPVEGAIYRIRMELTKKICKSELQVKSEDGAWVIPEQTVETSKLRC